MCPDTSVDAQRYICCGLPSTTRNRARNQKRQDKRRWKIQRFAYLATCLQSLMDPMDFIPLQKLTTANLAGIFMLIGIAFADAQMMPDGAIARGLASSFGVTEESLEKDCSDLTDAKLCFFYPRLSDLSFRLGSDMTMMVSSRTINANENGPLPQGNAERTDRIRAFVTGAIFIIGAAKPNLSDAECGDFLKAAIERATKHGSIKDAEWIDSGSPGSPRFKLVNEDGGLRLNVRMAFDPIVFKSRSVTSNAALVAAIDGSLPDEVQAFAGKTALFVHVKTEGNVICADQSSPLMVADMNGQFIALNGTTRSWSENQNLRVFRSYKWHTVLDPKDTPGLKLGLDEVQRMIDVALRLCPAPKGIEEGYRWVQQAEQNRKQLGAKYFGLQ